MPSAVNACQAPLIGRYGLWPNFLPLSERPEFMHERIVALITSEIFAAHRHAEDTAITAERDGRDDKFLEPVSLRSGDI
jgi:hypothetical protein